MRQSARKVLSQCACACSLIKGGAKVAGRHEKLVRRDNACACNCSPLSELRDVEGSGMLRARCHCSTFKGQAKGRDERHRASCRCGTLGRLVGLASRSRRKADERACLCSEENGLDGIVESKAIGGQCICKTLGHLRRTIGITKRATGCRCRKLKREMKGRVSLSPAGRLDKRDRGPSDEVSCLVSLAGRCRGLLRGARSNVDRACF